MFSLRSFIKDGFIQAIGNKPDYEIRLKSADWFAKGVLTEDDLAEIETAMSKNEETTEGEV